MGFSLVRALLRRRCRSTYIVTSVFWGTALVFFLAKWIDVGNTTTQDFWVEVCEQIENGGSVVTTFTELGLIFHSQGFFVSQGSASFPGAS